MNKVRLKVDGAKLTKIRESAIISCGKRPAPGPEPMRGSATAASSTNGSVGKTVSGQAHWSHRHPTPGSFVHSHSGLRSATATRVLHLRSWALYLTAGAGPHPARCTGIGYRRTLLNPILALRKHDAHPEDAPQRLMVRPGTLDACAELVLHRHSLRSPLFSLRSGVSLLFALDTLLPLSPFYAPLPPLHRPSTSPEDKIQPRIEFKARFC